MQFTIRSLLTTMTVVAFLLATSIQFPTVAPIFFALCGAILARYIAAGIGHAPFSVWVCTATGGMATAHFGTLLLDPDLVWRSDFLQVVSVVLGIAATLLIEMVCWAKKVFRSFFVLGR